VSLGAPIQVKMTADTERIADIQIQGGLKDGFSGRPVLLCLGGRWVCIGVVRLGREDAATSRFIAADVIVDFLREVGVGGIECVSASDFILPPSDVADPTGKANRALDGSRQAPGRSRAAREFPERPGSRREKVLAFLDNLARNGLADDLHFLPQWIAPRDVEKTLGFCLPPQVVDEKEWQRARRQQIGNRTAATSGFDLEYVLPTSEEMLRGTAEGRISTRPFHLVFAEHGICHYLLRGEPGEGKTTALWLEVAHHCRQLGTDLQEGRCDADGPGCRVPLVLPLSKVIRPGGFPDSLDLIGMARRETLRLAFDNSVPEEVSTWLNEKIEREQFLIFLDALDELDERYDEALRNSLARLEGVPVLLTSRLTVADAQKKLVQPRCYRLVCFGQRQIREYIRRYFSGAPEGEQQVQEIWHRLRQTPGPREMVQLPLLAAILCDEHAISPTEPLPTSRTELLCLALHRLMERGDQRRLKKRNRPRNLIKEKILYEVAWNYYFDGPEPILEDPLLELLQRQLPLFESSVPDDAAPKDAKDLLDEYLLDGVLACIGSA
jgi:hypothetical protein